MKTQIILFLVLSLIVCQSINHCIIKTYNTKLFLISVENIFCHKLCIERTHASKIIQNNMYNWHVGICYHTGIPQIINI